MNMSRERRMDEIMAPLSKLELADRTQASLFAVKSGIVQL